MKSLKLLILSVASFALASSLNSCNEDKDSNLVFFEIPDNLSYTSEGYWADCYETRYNMMGLTLNPFNFSHNAQITEWDGVTYKSWKGFCPSKVVDRTDYSNENWPDHQWAAIAGDNGSPFMLACWDVTENYESPETAQACVIKFADAMLFKPQTVFITNSAYGYYAMKNGTAFNKAFDKNDYTFVRIYGMNGTKATGHIDVYLARNEQIADGWLGVDLSGLGSVSSLVFTMASSDTGQWGMNNPAYFCLSGLSYSL